MALMFSNTFSAAYYKQLHRYVHQNYHAHLAKYNLIKLLKNPFKPSVKRLRKAASFMYHAPATLIEGFKLYQLEKTI
jgi:hypothetical protein